MKSFPTPTVLVISLAVLIGTAALLGRCAARPTPSEDGAVAAVEPAAASMPSMQDVQIIDAAGFGRPMVSATTQIPAGWHTQGGVDWDRSSDCVTNHLRATGERCRNLSTRP